MMEALIVAAYMELSDMNSTHPPGHTIFSICKTDAQVALEKS